MDTVEVGEVAEDGGRKERRGLGLTLPDCQGRITSGLATTWHLNYISTIVSPLNSVLRQRSRTELTKC